MGATFYYIIDINYLRPTYYVTYCAALWLYMGQFKATTMAAYKEIFVEICVEEHYKFSNTIFLIYVHNTQFSTVERFLLIINQNRTIYIYIYIYILFNSILLRVWICYVTEVLKEFIA